MTQLECEKKVYSLLEEIAKVFKDYGHGNHLSMSIIGDHINAFAFESEDSDKYSLSLTRYEDGDVEFRGDHHD